MFNVESEIINKKMKNYTRHRIGNCVICMFNTIFYLNQKYL
jgi:hypothetical protein